MIVPIFLPHLGCGAKCIYCDQVNITDIRSDHTGDTIRKYLDPLTDKVEVGLYGGNLFGLDAEALKRLFAWFEPYRDRITGFRISTKPVPLHEETIRVLKEKGVDTVELGIPCFDDAILSTLGRRHSSADLLAAFVRLKEEGFKVALQLMVGLPGETMAHIRESAGHIVRLAPDYIRIYPLVVLKGTPLEAMYRKGAFVPAAFEEVVERALYIYLRATERGIKVVKMGLTENEIIKERVVAGHYHPAFGYVVKTWAFRLAVAAKIRALSLKGPVTARINNRDVPHLLGERRSNMARFEASGVQISYETGEVAQGSFVLIQGTLSVEGSIYDALTMIPSQDPISPHK
jgi:histone acetyltransferase (RNA polymerase elongator complex component)